MSTTLFAGKLIQKGFFPLPFSCGGLHKSCVREAPVIPCCSGRNRNCTIVTCPRYSVAPIKSSSNQISKAGLLRNYRVKGSSAYEFGHAHGAADHIITNAKFLVCSGTRHVVKTEQEFELGSSTCTVLFTKPLCESSSYKPLPPICFL